MLFQLTKESRIALQAGEHINKPTLTQEYSNLDKAARGAEAYLKKRLEELEGIKATFMEMLEDKERERIQLLVNSFGINAGSECRIPKCRTKNTEGTLPDEFNRDLVQILNH